MNGGRIDSSTSGRGNAGSVNINSRDRIHIQGKTTRGDASGIYSSVEATGIGDGRNITLNTTSLELHDEGTISASTEGQGNAGDIDITARNIQRWQNCRGNLLHRYRTRRHSHQPRRSPLFNAFGSRMGNSRK